MSSCDLQHSYVYYIYTDPEPGMCLFRSKGCLSDLFHYPHIKVRPFVQSTAFCFLEVFRVELHIHGPTLTLAHLSPFKLDLSSMPTNFAVILTETTERYVISNAEWH